ncbi:MAG: 4Fe-4S binding protein [Negativicutes bacterium]
MLSVKKNSTAIPDWISKLSPMRLPWFLFLTMILILGIGWPMYFTPFHLLTEELSRIWRQQIPWMLVLLIVLGLITFPRFWCVYVCPTGLLFTFLSHWRVFRVKPSENCIHCGLCEKICPTGAIAPVSIPQVLMGSAMIDHSLCLGWAHGKLCLVCKEQCPQHAIDSDSQNRPSVQAEKCVGCGGCENACPVDPAAIVVKPQPKRRHGKIKKSAG